MCEWTRNSSKKIDPCIKKFIRILQNMGVGTKGSCCGHGVYRLTVIVEKEDGTRMDLISGIEIPRRFKSYKLDDDGRYYIPEVEHA